MAMNKIEFCYAVLGLPTTATAAEVKGAYRRLAQKYHPDMNADSGAEEIFKLIQLAYQAVKDREPSPVAVQPKTRLPHPHEVDRSTQRRSVLTSNGWLAPDGPR